MTEQERIQAKMKDFAQELKALPEKDAYQMEACSEERFALLLGGISAFRKVPGLEGPDKYEELRRCDSVESTQLVQDHLFHLYRATDQATLLEACERVFNTDNQYRQFLAFWDGTPPFDVEELTEPGREAFLVSRDYAALFRPYVERQGFFAWDCNERIGLLRAAAACGIVGEDKFWSEAKRLARRAAVLYATWEEYAMGCLCGAMYFMFGQNGYRREGLENFCDINLRLLRHLLSDEGAWTRAGWHRFEGKRFALSPADLRNLLRDWEGPEGCVATDRITVDGRKVGYLYREPPAPNMPDSGWRFFAGDESEEYTADPANSEVFSLNTICNYDAEILPLLHAPVGSAFFRDESGMFRKEKREYRE